MTRIDRQPTPTAVRKAPHVNSDFTELARTIQASGLMRRRYGYYWMKLVGLPLLVVATLTVFVLIGDTWWPLVTAVVLGVVFTQVALLGPDAPHRQLFVPGKGSERGRGGK